MKLLEELSRSRIAVTSQRWVLIGVSLLIVSGMARSSDAGVARFDRLLEDEHRPRLTLLWHDGYRLASESFRIMAWEVEAIFSEIGVEVCWHDGSHGLWRENEPPRSIEIRLVLLPVDSGDWGFERQVMGAAVKNPGMPDRTHTVYAFYPNVLRTLGIHADAVAENVGKWRAVARALGRVLAHEIVHAIAPGQPHREAGLMGKQLRRSILLKRELRLDPVSARVLRSKLQT